MIRFTECSRLVCSNRLLLLWTALPGIWHNDCKVNAAVYLTYGEIAMVREVKENELHQVLELYLHLHEESIPEMTEHLERTWNTIMKDNNHHIVVKEIDGKIVSSCVCVIIPNLTRGVRPYAFVENVVTHSDYRGRGYATECLNYAKAIAERENCYKMMLLTGSKKETTLRFYEKAGYNSTDKTAFIQWL